MVSFTTTQRQPGNRVEKMGQLLLKIKYEWGNTMKNKMHVEGEEKLSCMKDG
jgi:hypothetical protein